MALSRRRPAGWFAFRLHLEYLEERLAPTGNITITNAFLVNSNGQPLAAVNIGEDVYVQASFTTQDLPSTASYRVSYTVNGLTLDTGYITWGAGSWGRITGTLIGAFFWPRPVRTKSRSPLIRTTPCGGDEL